MDPSSSELPLCPFCAVGLPHPRPRGVLTVRGSIMRRGGTFEDPETGIVISGDTWVRLRCAGCGTESMTPEDALGDVPVRQDHDGTFQTVCQRCALAGLAGEFHHRTRRGRTRHRHG